MTKWEKITMLLEVVLLSVISSLIGNSFGEAFPVNKMLIVAGILSALVLLLSLFGKIRRKREEKRPGSIG